MKNKINSCEITSKNMNYLEVEDMEYIYIENYKTLPREGLSHTPYLQLADGCLWWELCIL